MILGSMNWDFLRLPFIDRRPIREAITLVPDRGTPEYPRFLAEVRARTAPGDTIVIMVPRRWRSGYDYAFYRATYLLSGRSVIPLLDDRDKTYPERIATADFVAAWQTRFEAPAFTTVWQGHDGHLARRNR